MVCEGEVRINNAIMRSETLSVGIYKYQSKLDEGKLKW